MKVGLFFGSFNPIHVGHIILANHLVEFTDLNEVWLVVTPHNPLKQKSSLLADYHRYEMALLATEKFEKIKPTNIEFNLPQPNYTVNTLAHLNEKFPKITFSLIMGEDNLRSLHKWRNYQYLMENFKIWVYPRVGTFDANEKNVSHQNICKIDAPIIELSSTFIRNALREGKNISPMLDAKVLQYITHNLFYKK